uniref:Doublecortin-like kinase 3 n=1 Tax=Takifugu rubripes TaxID=31033 RepID=A0A674MEB7_TAKRU
MDSNNTPPDPDNTKTLKHHTNEDIERCYDIGRVVGDGNFAVVRECRRRDNGQTLAVKIVERSKLAGREHMMQNELWLRTAGRGRPTTRLKETRNGTKTMPQN